jgi:hypothetical protein
MMRATWILAAAFAAMPAPAFAQDFDPARVVTSVGQADLLSVVGALEHTVVEEGAGDQAFVVATSGEGVTYVLFGTACGANGDPGCQGILMQVRLAMPPGTTAETLAKANAAQAAVTAWADFDAKLLLFSRYVVLDDGVTIANIRANVNVLLAALPTAYPVAVGAQESG